MKDEKTFASLMSLSPNSTMARAYLLMDRLKIKNIPVTCNHEVVGVVTNRDITQLIEQYALQGENKRQLTVGNFMRGPVEEVAPDSGFAEVIRMMLNRQLEALVVKSEDGQVLGTLTRDDLLEVLAQLSEESKTQVLEGLVRMNSSTPERT